MIYHILIILKIQGRTHNFCSLLCSLFHDIASAGIAAPGSANPDTGIIGYSNNLPMLNYPICAKLKERT